MRRIGSIVALMFGLTLIGAAGFKVLTGTPWVHCFYLAVITLTTVGMREPEPLTDASRVFVILYLVGGLGVFTYSAFTLGQFVLNVRMRSMLERRRMEHRIATLRDHHIVCGMGRMGTIICEHLASRRRPFVVIDIDEERLAPHCEEHGWLYVPGDATDDETLLKAGIQRASSLASVLPTDADNVYVVLATHLLVPELVIIARASTDRAVDKLQRAGASRVVSPISTGATKMARFMLSPSIEDVLEISDARGTDLELADVQITPDSPYVGKRLMDTDLRAQGVMIIGIRRANGERLMPPEDTAVVESGDSLSAFGSSQAVNAMIGETDRPR